MVNTKQINTTIPASLHKAALINDVKWSEALKIGIKVLTGLSDDEGKLKEQIQQKENELIVLNKQLDDLIEERKKREEANKPKYYTNPHDMYKDM